VSESTALAETRQKASRINLTLFFGKLAKIDTDLDIVSLGWRQYRYLDVWLNYTGH
jgi:hypothetical protein